MAVSPTTVTAKVRINKRDRTVTSIERTNGVVTIETTAAHGYTVGSSVSVASTGDDAASINGSYIIATIPSSTTFTYRQRHNRNSDEYADIANDAAAAGAVIEVLNIAMPDGQMYTTSDADQDIFIPVDHYHQLNPALVGAAPKLFTDQTA